MGMSTHLFHGDLAQNERLEAIAALLGHGFLRLQPSRLERLRSATTCAEDSALCPSISLDKEAVKSVHASVNQE